MRFNYTRGHALFGGTRHAITRNYTHLAKNSPLPAVMNCTPITRNYTRPITRNAPHIKGCKRVIHPAEKFGPRSISNTIYISAMVEREVSMPPTTGAGDLRLRLLSLLLPSPTLLLRHEAEG